MKNTNMSERICVDCHTTKTPMWRSGPAGPRSLCNACGIKHRKRNRLLLGPSSRVMMKKSETISSDDDGRRRPWNMREDEEAAILLMALSCGSVVYA